MVHAKAPRNSVPSSAFWLFLCSKHTWCGSLLGYLPHHGPPHVEKKIHSGCNDGRGWESQLARVCVSPEKTCCLCVRSLRSATPRFSPLFSRGERALSVIVSEPTQPLMLSHASGRHSLSPAYLALSQFLRAPFFHNLSQEILLLSHKFVSAVTECLHKSECLPSK